MTCRALAGILSLCLFVAGIGCARIPKESGFADVSRLVGERNPHQIRWVQGGKEDERAEAAVRALLKEELTAASAVQVALLNNPSIQTTYEKLGVTQADVVQAGLLRNPVFGLMARFPHDPPSKTNLEFQVAQDFLDLLMIPNRKALASEQFERVKQLVANEVVDLAAEVQRVYYTVLGLRQLSHLRRLVTDAASASFEMAGRIHAAGNISDLGLAMEQAQYERSRVALAQVETDRLTYRERLTRLMGLWGNQTAWRLPDQLPAIPEDEIPLDRLESFAVTNRLDLAAARKEMEVVALALGIAMDLRWLGHVELGLSAERDSDGQWVTGPTLSLALPLFDQKQADLARLEAQLRESEHRFKAKAIEVRSEVRAARERLLGARETAAHYRKVLIPLEERIVALTLKEYNYMLAGVFQLLMAKQREYDAYQGYIEAVRDYWVMRAELERVLGGRLPGPSERIPAPPPPMVDKTRPDSPGERHDTGHPDSPMGPQGGDHSH